MGTANKYTISKKAEIMDVGTCEEYVRRVLSRRTIISDINVTCKIEPFMADAHAVLMSKEDNETHIEQMLYVQEQTGVPMSLVFNNIYVPNDLTHLHIFIKNFRKYYEIGIRNVTLPHLFWMKTGLIKNEFPNLYVKSTVLRRVRTGQDFWNYAEAGFDCINVDRLLMRNIDALREIRNAQEKFYNLNGKYVSISMVINEGCKGNCPFWEEHYQHSLTSDLCLQEGTNKKGFNLIPKYSGCRDVNNVCLSRTNLVVCKEDLEEVFKYIDIIKIGGRRHQVDAFKLIDMILDDGYVCHPLLQKIYVEGKKEEIGLLERWRVAIKNCGYQCWKCNLCKELDTIILKRNQ